MDCTISPQRIATTLSQNRSTRKLTSARAAHERTAAIAARLDREIVGSKPIGRTVASARSRSAAIAAFFLLCFLSSFELVACQSAPSENRATSGEAAAAAAPSRDAQPRGSESRANSSDRYDLERDEQRGGHTLDKHVGRTDDQLRERLDRERDISAASTWTDLPAAEETVAAALHANQGKIDRWNERGFPRPNLALHFDAGHSIGRTMRHGENSSEPCSGAVVVLKADRDGGFFVLTTYPEDRE